MRHAQAGNLGGVVTSDADRLLTDYGRAQSLRVALELKRQSVVPDVIFSSLYKRALQTAQLVSEQLKGSRVQTCAALSSSGKVPEMSGILKERSPADTVLLVGHQPDMGLLSQLLCGEEIGFPTACVAAFEWVPAATHSRFLWSIKPEDLP